MLKLIVKQICVHELLIIISHRTNITYHGDYQIMHVHEPY